jgi:hypothetical protein
MHNDVTPNLQIILPAIFQARAKNQRPLLYRQTGPKSTF